MVRDRVFVIGGLDELVDQRGGGDVPDRVLGSLRRDMLPGLLPVWRDLDPGGAGILRIAQPPDQAGGIELADDPG